MANEKRRKYQREWHNRYYRKNKAKVIAQHRRAHARREYGVTDKIWKEIEHRLNVGPCDVCGKSARMCIDHDHITGDFRGLLCNECNRGIGLLHDNPEILQKAVDYLG